jgi:glutaredoxin 3
MRFVAPFLFAFIAMFSPTNAEIQGEAKPKVVIYTIPNCPGCSWAKSFFNTRGIPFEEIDIKGRPDLYREMKLDESMTVPRIFVNGKHLGSSTNLSDDSLKALMSEPVKASGVKENEQPLKRASKRTDS